MASTIVTRTDRFRAAVVGAGVTDLMSMARTCDIPDSNRAYFGAWPWEDPQVYVDLDWINRYTLSQAPVAARPARPPATSGKGMESDPR